MTTQDHPSVPDLRGELHEIETQIQRLQVRRTWILGQLDHDAAPARPGASVQQVLLATGAGLLGLAGLFFAAVAWTLVGPAGQLVLLLSLGAGLAVLASWTRPRLAAAAGALASVAASLVATAGYAVPELWQVDWSATGLATWTAAVSAVLCAAYAAAALVTGIRSWTVASALAATVGVVATGVAAVAATEDALGYSVATAVLTVAVAAAGRHVRARRAWACVLAVSAGTSLLSLGGWLADPERTVAYAAVMVGWAVVAQLGHALAPSRIPALAARTLGAMLLAGAASLLVGAIPWGAPNLPLAAVGVLLALVVAYLPATPLLPGAAAALVLGVGAVTVPEALGTAAGTEEWIGFLCLVAVAGAATGWSPRRALGAVARGLLWWSAGLAAGAAWVVHLSRSPLDGPVEWLALPVGGLLVLAGAGWMLSVRRTTGLHLPSVAALLPGLAVAVLPGALASWSLTWDAGLSDALVRTVCYTLVGAVLVALGARLRVAALLVAGEATVAVCVLAHLSAATQELPQWVVLAVAGALLLAVGMRWEWLRSRGTAATRWVGELR